MRSKIAGSKLDTTMAMRRQMRSAAAMNWVNAARYVRSCGVAPTVTTAMATAMNPGATTAMTPCIIAARAANVRGARRSAATRYET